MVMPSSTCTLQVDLFVIFNSGIFLNCENYQVIKMLKYEHYCCILLKDRIGTFDSPFRQPMNSNQRHKTLSSRNVDFRNS